MKIVLCGKGYGKSINFIDDNDVFVGYDLAQGCCESAGWFIEGFGGVFTDAEMGLSGYSFERDFFQEWYPLGDRHGDDVQHGLEAGGVAVFRIVADDTVGTPPLGEAAYLVLYNSHNGYYGHGFEVKHGGEVVRTGDL